MSSASYAKEIPARVSNLVVIAGTEAECRSGVEDEITRRTAAGAILVHFDDPTKLTHGGWLSVGTCIVPERTR